MSHSPDALPSFIFPDVSLSQIPLKNPPKLGFMASGSGTNFAAIAESIQSNELNAKIEVLIYNNPKAKVQEQAEKYQVPKVLINHRDFASREALDEAIVTTFKEYGVEWIIMAGWMRIITPVLLNAFAERVINIHPSLLPSFRGIRAIEQALAAGVKVTGCTVHFASLEVDSGPIIAQAVVPVLPNDTAETLHARIQIQEQKIFPRAIAIAAQRAEISASS
jgi:phosphoribosylglycinamide formyltransferase-1